jgi:PAS domain S-box-containing protein
MENSCIKIKIIDFRDLVENSNDIIWQMDVKGRITYINKAVETELGYSRDEIIGTTIPPHIPEEEKERFEKISYLLREVSPRSFEGLVHPRRHKDGRTFLFEIKGKPFFDKNGKFLGYRGISRKVPDDMTKEKRLNDRILGEHIIFESIINTLPIRIFWKDRNFRYLGANRLFLQDLGVERLDEILGKEDFTLLKPETAEICRRGDLQILHTGRDMHDEEGVIYTHTGKKMWISLYKKALHDRSGNIFGILGAYIDITKLKMQEIQLKENSCRLKEAQQMAKIGYWDFNLSDRSISWSEETYRIFGYTPSEQPISFETFLQHIIPEEREKLHRALEHATENRDSEFNIVYTIHKKDGTKAVLHSSAYLIYDFQQQPLWMKGVVQDITESYRLQKENEAKQALLMHQTRLAQMGRLLNNIAHQWKQPLAGLNALLLDMDTDYRHGKLDEKRFNWYFEQFEKVTGFMGDTIETFQEYTTPSKELTLIEPAEALDEALTLLRSRIEEVGAKVDIRCRTCIKTVGTKQDIVHLFLVLLNNALDALDARQTPNPKIEILIKTYEDGEENRCEISIRDNAGGIAPDVAKQMFDPYFTTKFKEKGRGIGLYMAKMIVENRMQGTLRLAEAKKSLFKIVLKGVA